MPLWPTGCRGRSHPGQYPSPCEAKESKTKERDRERVGLAEHGGRPKNDHQIWHEQHGDENNHHSSGDEGTNQSAVTSHRHRRCLTQTGVRRRISGKAESEDDRHEVDDYWLWLLRRKLGCSRLPTQLKTTAGYSRGGGHGANTAIHDR